VIQQLTNIRVANWANTVTYATAPTGDYMVDGALQQVMTQNQVIQNPLVEETRYLVYSDQYPAMSLIYQGLANGDLWFVSQ
jgi:hypothetical protein